MRPPSVPQLLGHLVSAIPLSRDQLTTRAKTDRSHSALEAENVRGDANDFVLNPPCSQMRPSVCSVGLTVLRRLQIRVKESSACLLFSTTWDRRCNRFKHSVEAAS